MIGVQLQMRPDLFGDRIAAIFEFETHVERRAISGEYKVAEYSYVGGDPRTRLFRKSVLRNSRLASDFLPLQTHENQIAETDKRQDPINYNRRRRQIACFVIGFCLFLSAYGLLFYSGQRFSESTFDRLQFGQRYYWDLGLLILNGFIGWLGVFLMLMAPRFF